MEEGGGVQWPPLIAVTSFSLSIWVWSTCSENVFRLCFCLLCLTAVVKLVFYCYNLYSKDDEADMVGVQGHVWF